MPFDAGTIIARLELDESGFDRKLAAAERRQQEFERRSGKSMVKLGVSTQEASQMRRQMDQLDRQLTQDAVRRSNSGQGSVLATLLGMSSPAAARAQATQQAQAQKSLLSRLGGMFGGGGGGSSGGGGSGGGGGNSFIARLLGGIGPQILGMGGKATLMTGLGSLGLGALPGLVGGLAPLGIGAAGLGIAAGLGSQVAGPASSLVSAQAAAQKALAAATTPAQLKAAQAQLASVNKQVAALSPALQSVFHSLAGFQKWWQGFTKSLAPMIAGPIHEITSLIEKLGPDLRMVFGGAMTVVMPFIRGITDIAKVILPLLNQAFRASAPFIRPLLDGLGKLAGGVLKGLIPLLKAAAPAVKALSGVFATLGSGIGKMLSEFAPAVKASSVIIVALGKVLGGLFPIIGQLAGVFARTLAPIFMQFARVLRTLEPILAIIGRVFASLAGAILKDLVSAFGALANLLIGIEPAIRIFATALSRVFTVLENSGVFAVLGNALEAIVPILAKLINTLVRQLAPILPVLITLAGQFASILVNLLAAGLTTILTAVLALITHFKWLVPALAVVTAAWWLFNVALAANPIGLVIIAAVALIGAITLLVKHWSQVWGTIKSVAADAWKFIWDGFGKYLLPLLGPVGLIALGAIELAKHWSQITGAIKGDAQSLWQHLVGWGDDIKKLFTQTIPGYWDDFWHATVGRLINPVEGGLSRLWRNFQNWGQDVRNLFTNTIPNIFDQAVRAISRAWGAIESAVKGPVKWVVDHVINGLISAFDWISGKVGGPHINQVHPMGLATGGRIPGYGGGDRHVALLEGGEAVISKETTAQHAEQLRRWGVPGFARGGKVGQNPPTGNPHLPHGEPNPGGGIGGIFHKLGDIGKIMAAVFTGNTTALTNAIMAMIPGAAGHGVADLGKLLVDIPKTLLKDAVKTLISAGGIGADAGAIVKYAASFIGKVPYVWGGTAVPGGADCSGFVEAIYRHFGINAPRTSEAQGAWVRKTGRAEAGGLAFYNSPAGGAPPGHVAIVTGKGTVISQGGGMGPQVEPLNIPGLPLMWTGIPPGGLGSAGSNLRGPVQQIARTLLGKHGWGGQWGAFDSLETREAGWNIHAQNPGSGAYGLAQFINGPSEYAQYGGNSRTAAGQLVAMMNYIAQRYGSPNAAWAHELSAGWYDDGGWMQPGISVNGTGRREAVLNPPQSDAFVAMAEALRSQAANSGSSRLEQLLERVIAAVDRNAVTTGKAVGGALDGASRTAFYNSQYQTGGA